MKKMLKEFADSHEAYWFVKGKFYPVKDEFHHQFIVKNADLFGMEQFVDNLVTDYGFKDTDSLADSLDEAGSKDLADKIMDKALKDGAVRVRPLGGLNYVSCGSTLNKKAIDNVLKCVMDDASNFTPKAETFVMFSSDGFCDSIHASSKRELISSLAEKLDEAKKKKLVKSLLFEKVIRL